MSIQEIVQSIYPTLTLEQCDEFLRLPSYKDFRGIPEFHEANLEREQVEFYTLMIKESFRTGKTIAVITDHNPLYYTDHAHSNYGEVLIYEVFCDSFVLEKRCVYSRQIDEDCVNEWKSNPKSWLPKTFAMHCFPNAIATLASELDTLTFYYD